MPKIKREENEKKEASIEFIRKCKADIAKFGFKVGDYERFLISVKAMREDGKTVLQYPNENIVNYRDDFLKKNENTFEDSFILDNFRIMTCDEIGKKQETGYFCPRSFWDYILHTKI